MTYLERQRQELQRRMGGERRQRMMAIGAHLLHERRFRQEDRRTDDDRRSDNRNVGDWMRRFDDLRNAA